MNNRNIVKVCLILFAITFYWVEFSPWSSSAVASYNDGYGTFDMKQYGTEEVETVLGHMELEGFDIYDRYLIGDCFFILALGSIQILLSSSVCNGKKFSGLRNVLIGIAIARGCFDLVENIMLFMILHGYPDISQSQIRISSMATSIKLACIGLWSVLFLVGFVWARRSRVKSQSSSY